MDVASLLLRTDSVETEEGVEDDVAEVETEEDDRNGFLNDPFKAD